MRLKKPLIRVFIPDENDSDTKEVISLLEKAGYYPITMPSAIRYPFIKGGAIYYIGIEKIKEFIKKG
jgi:hypothetical protein